MSATLDTGGAAPVHVPRKAALASFVGSAL
jgi:hypothetical protein